MMAAVTRFIRRAAFAVAAAALMVPAGARAQLSVTIPGRK
jgi:hypothetical protein